MQEFERHWKEEKKNQIKDEEQCETWKKTTDHWNQEC